MQLISRSFFCDSQSLCAVSLLICRKGRVITFYLISRTSPTETIGKRRNPSKHMSRGIACTALRRRALRHALSDDHPSYSWVIPSVRNNLIFPPRIVAKVAILCGFPERILLKLVFLAADPIPGDRIFISSQVPLQKHMRLRIKLFRFPKSKRLNRKSKANVKINFSS